MKTCMIILCLCLAGVTEGQSTIGAILHKPDFSLSVDKQIQKYVELDIFSGVVLIAHEGDPVYYKAFGYADREHQVPNTLHTKFIIGSMNKTFTEVVILQLVDEGRLHLTDRLVDLLPGFEQDGADRITIRQLLNHTSGLGDYNSPDFWNLPSDQKTLSGILRLIRQMPLDFAPGTDQQYSNAGYILLGAIIEKETGESYADNVRARITVPLGMSETYLEDNANVPEKSIGYLKTIHGIEDNKDLILEPRSDGGFWSVATDVMTFYRNYFYGDKLLSTSGREASDLLQHLQPAYQQPGAAIPIAGGMNGLNAVHLEFLSDHVSVVVLANMDEPVAENIALDIHAMLNNKEPREPALPAALCVYQAYKEHGAEFIKAHFEELTVNFHPTDPKDLILNNLGYMLMEADKLDEALDLFKVNTELFPEVANCWDSYGEALRAKGDRQGALEAYREALQINPEVRTAQRAVRELERE